MPRVSHVTEVKLRQSRSHKSHGPARGHKWSRIGVDGECDIGRENTRLFTNFMDNQVGLKLSVLRHKRVFIRA
eukprot:1161314-Prymnesium_polylepis.1